MKLNILNKLGINLIIFISFYFSNFIGQKVISEEILNYPKASYLRRIPDNNFYILDTGDTISIKVSEEAPELDQLITIDGAGTVILSRLKKIYISGLTIGELTNILNKEYSKYVLKPDIKIEVMQYRPIQIYVDGEVENPGLHVLKGSSSPLTDSVKFSNENQTSIEESSFESKNIFPTVINALEKVVELQHANLKILR